MNFTPLTAISPIDGRYRNKADELGAYFSEYALFKYRLLVEVEYFIALCEEPLPQLESFDKSKFSALRKLYEFFSVDDAQAMKDIEKITNHDVKAMEYFLKEKFDELGLSSYKEFIHFGLTSQDINNTAQPMMLRDAFENVLKPFLQKIQTSILGKSKEWSDVPLLSRTHGQPASPTKLGKEWYVFYERIQNQFELLEQIPFCGKFGGAIGNFNAHFVAYPSIDWINFSNKFLLDKLGLKRLKTTTQIEHYDHFAAFCDAIKRINTIFIDFSRDVWAYVSMDYFKQKIKEGEVGSSAMPHKVNPIDFENAEGNLGIANAIFEHFSAKLPISRLQRDLTDSTVMRNMGVPIAHTIIALASLEKGIHKLLINQEKIKSDIENNWAVVAEALQTILRRENYTNPYETLKTLTRTNQKIDEAAISNFIYKLDVDESIKEEMRKIRPENYTGIF